MGPKALDAIPDEQQFIAGLKAGDPADFERLVRSNIAWMLALSLRLVRDEALAEDCVQEAFTNAFRKIQGFETRSSLKTWLHRITVNSSLMKLRSLKRREEEPIDALQPQFDEFACRIEAPWSGLAQPDEILERDDLRRIVLSKINQLPEIYRQVLLLRDIEELEMAEVAELMDLKPGTVKVRLHRGRSALKKLLEPILRGET